MKLIALAVLILLAGCSNRPTLVELEDEAIVTGDWSAVEERERSMQRRQAREAVVCPEDETRVCYGPELSQHCICVQSRSVTFSR
ncbi:MAG: hypothetical protein OEO82_00480 [Gammaproteobacteria bacterium]|nr:hypothetical protein [Gammaproteobacteria bacterium]